MADYPPNCLARAAGEQVSARLWVYSGMRIPPSSIVRRTHTPSPPTKDAGSASRRCRLVLMVCERLVHQLRNSISIHAPSALPKGFIVEQAHAPDRRPRPGQFPGLVGGPDGCSVCFGVVSIGSIDPALCGARTPRSRTHSFKNFGRRTFAGLQRAVHEARPARRRLAPRKVNPATRRPQRRSDRR